MMSIALTGWDEAIDMLRQLPEKHIKPVIRTAFRDVAKQIQKDAKARAPQATGDLKMWIKVRAMTKRKRGGISISVMSTSIPKLTKEGKKFAGFKVIHAEYGTSDTRPRPYLRPAFYSHVGDLLEMLKVKLKERIEKKLT